MITKGLSEFGLCFSGPVVEGEQGECGTEAELSDGDCGSSYSVTWTASWRGPGLSFFPELKASHLVSCKNGSSLRLHPCPQQSGLTATEIRLPGAGPLGVPDNAYK